MRGYMVACTAFYERGFSVPSHWFLCSLLQFYDLELHHLTPSRVLHIAAFVTLCEAHIRIEPHFTLWDHFFRAWFLQGLGTEVAILGGVDIHIRSGHGVNPYFHLPMSRSLNGWQRV
jgi:hypothetical protein